MRPGLISLNRLNRQTLSKQSDDTEIKKEEVLNTLLPGIVYLLLIDQNVAAPHCR